MPSSAQKISEYILAAFQEVGDPITTAKLHKLLYYTLGLPGRVHGILVDEVFYVVWLDPEHRLYQ